MGIDVDSFRGSLLGLALGDALGAPYEGGPLERASWLLLGKTLQGKRRFTDDTQMALDLAASLIERGEIDQDDLAVRFARSYRWSRGYGPGAARVLKRVRGGRPWREASRSVYPDGSFGNGAAMRSPVVGLFFADVPGAMIEAARGSGEVTHAHPLALEGAVVTATATACALADCAAGEILDAAAARATSRDFVDRFAVARHWLGERAPPSPREVRARLGMGIVAVESCVTAIYLAVRFADAPFGDLVAFTASCGGDVDTVGAMAGAIWGARNGHARLPQFELAGLEAAERIDDVAIALHARHAAR
jgi:poly(ADP-ribose) glycohydrolase ARH3